MKGIRFRAKVIQVGNNIGITIPKRLLDLELGDQVIATLEKVVTNEQDRY